MEDEKNKDLEKKRGSAATRAKYKYNQRNYDRIAFSIKKGEKDRLKKSAERAGYNSLAAYIMAALNRFKAEKNYELTIKRALLLQALDYLLDIRQAEDSDYSDARNKHMKYKGFSQAAEILGFSKDFLRLDHEIAMFTDRDLFRLQLNDDEKSKFIERFL